MGWLIAAAMGLGAWMFEKSAKASPPAWRLLTALEGWRLEAPGEPPPPPNPIPEGMAVTLVIQNTTSGEILAVRAGVAGAGAKGTVSLALGVAIGKNGLPPAPPYGYEAGKFLDVDPAHIIFTH